MYPTASFLILFVSISIISFIAVVDVALIALESFGVFKSSKSSSVTSNSPNPSNLSSPSDDLVVSALNDVSIYPNVSYSELLSSFTQVSNTFILQTINESILEEVGSIDNTSSIFEVGRTQYLYFQLPPGGSTRSA